MAKRSLRRPSPAPAVAGLVAAVPVALKEVRRPKVPRAARVGRAAPAQHEEKAGAVVIPEVARSRRLPLLRRIEEPA